MLVKKSIPSHKLSNSTLAVAELERVRFALSQAVFSLLNDLLFSVKSVLCFLLNICIILLYKRCIIRQNTLRRRPYTDRRFACYYLSLLLLFLVAEKKIFGDLWNRSHSFIRPSVR